MEAGFWHERWERGEIGFHESETNPFLVEHFARLNLPSGSRIFVPLCGKTRDFAWLLAQGYSVAGAELSKLAITELFADLGLEPELTGIGALTRYSASGIDIFVGDIFALSAESLGPVSAIYDRAALVALPAPMREQYTAHLISITATAPQLLITFAYDQLQMDGPPFAVGADEVKKHYGTAYRIQSVASRNVAGGLKGKVAATETAWLLQKTNG